MKVTVIIPAYNEEQTISKCINSLINQSYKQLEIIVIDDGSTDNTLQILNKFEIKILQQAHKGPGHARNLGAENSMGEILVFVDSDMHFDKNFIEELTLPIRKGKSKGTFSKNELNGNVNNIWSQCWNFNRVGDVYKLVPTSSIHSPVYRAILKKEFVKVNGFTTKGEYTDDWSLSEKLKTKATLAKGAKYYHTNPATLSEIWNQARWFSTNKFISGDPVRFFRSLFLYSLPVSLIIGYFRAFLYVKPHYFLFRLWFDMSVFLALLSSPLKANKAK